MRRVLWCAVVSALVTAVMGTFPATAQDPERAPNRYPVTNVTQLCADLGSRILRYDASGSCRRGEELVQLRVSERLAVCSTRDRRVLQIPQGACARKGGKTHRIPAATPVFFCADRRSGSLRGTPKPSLCHDAVERALRSRNLAPTAVSLDGRTVTENVPVGSAVGSLFARDPNPGDRHNFRLVPGPGSSDNGAFSITGGVLRTRLPVDAETQASYQIRVRATDILGRSAAKAFRLAVVDLDENADPTDIALAPATVAENQPTGTTVGTLTTTDPDAGDSHAYTLVTAPGVPNDNASFEVAGDSLRTLAPLDHETGTGTRTVRVISDDGNGGTVEKDLVLTVSDENDAPTALALSSSTVPENAAAEVVGTLTTTDQDPADTHTYTLVAGSGDGDNALFSVSGDQLSTAVALDFEDRAAYSVRIRTTDGDSASFEQALTVTVTDDNDAPSQVSLSPASVAENAAAGTTVGALSADDEDASDTHTFALVSGAGDADNASFTVVGGELQTTQSFDYEVKATYSVRAAATDGDGADVETALTVTVTNTNDQPTQLDLSATTVDENAAQGTTVGTLSTQDQDASETHTYSLVAGAGDDDNAGFTVVGDELRTAVGFDFETDTALTVRLRSTDSGAGTVERDFAIAVTDVNEAPTDLALSPSTVAENSPAGTVVGTLTGTDPDAGNTFTYSLVPGAGSDDNGDFAIVGGELRTATAFDHEARSSYSVRVRVTDGGAPGLTFEKQVTVTVIDVDETATQITLSPSSIAENKPVGTGVGTLSADDPDAGSMLTFSLVSGTGDDDNAAFAVSGTSLTALQSFDFETDASYSIRVAVDDGTSPVFAQQLAVTVTDANDVPTDLSLSDDHVAENAPVDTVVGTLTTQDQDASDTHTYTLVTGTGDIDNGSFTVVGDELRTAVVLDRETASTLSVRVSSDDGQATITEALAITVDNENEPPTSLLLSASTLPENTAPYDVGELSTSDPDSSAPYTFTLVNGAGDTDNADFTVVDSTLWATTAADFEHSPSRSVRVRVTDGDGAFLEQAFTITVLDGNDAPSGVVLTPSTVAENAPSGTTIGTLSTSDEATDTATFTLVAGAGDTDNALVTISGDTLATTAVLDHETTPTLSVRVLVTDGAGLVDEQQLTVTVTDVNEAPTGLALSATSVAENEPAGVLVGTLSANDPDVGDTVSYELVPGTGDADNASFAIDGDRLETVAPLNHEALGTRSVRVQVEDAAGQQAVQVFTITVTNVNEAPTGPTLNGGTVDENEPAGTLVGDLGTTDPDVGDTATYSLVSGAGDTDNAGFQVDTATGELETAVPLDFEADAERSVRVRVTDAGGLTSTSVLTITVIDVNDAPVAMSDTLSGAVGNTQAKRGTISTTGPTITLAGNLPLANDTDEDAGDTLTVVPATAVATTRGGTVDIVADGSFRFVPKAGDKSVTDTFSYTITDGEATATGTVSVTIGSRRIWWVDDNAVGTPDGRSTSPYASLGPLQGAGDPDDTGDEIFLYAGSYSTGIPLEANQVLTGQGVALEPSLVAAGARPVITAPNVTGVALANGSSVNGLDITASGTGNAVLASAVTTSTVGSTMTVTGSASDAVRIAGAAGGNITVSATVRGGGTGRAVSVENRTSGTVTFDGPVRTHTAPSGGVLIDSNGAGGSVRFTGGVELTTGTAAGFTAQNGGTVVVTGSANTLTSTTGTALAVSGTTIGTDGLNFRSISSAGAVNGIRLENTGFVGRLVVAGNSDGNCGGAVSSAGVVTSSPSSSDCTGGTIAGSTGAGVRLVGTNAPSFTRLWVRNGGDDGIFTSGVTGGLTVASSLIEDNGNAGAEDGIALGDSSSTGSQGATGTLAVTNTTVRRSGDVNVYLGNTSGTATLNVSGSQVHGAGTAGVTRDGVLAMAYGGATVTASVTGSSLEDNRGDHVQVSSGGTGSTTATITGNTMRTTGSAATVLGGGVTVSSASSPWSGNMRFDVGSNTINGAKASAVVVSEAFGTSGSAFSGFVRNNLIGTTQVPGSCSATASGIDVANDGGSGAMVLAVTGNVLHRCTERGIAMTVGDGGPKIDATITGNTVAELTDVVSTNGLFANFGITSADTGVSCFNASGNTLAFGPAATAGLRLRHRFAPLGLPGYLGGSADTVAVRSYLEARNSGLATVDLPVSGIFINVGASCTTP